MPGSDLSFYKDRILQLEAELNQVRSELIQCTQVVASTSFDDNELQCEHYLQLLFEVAFERLLIHSSFIIVDVNAAICEIWGRDASLRTKLIGENLLDFIGSNFRDLTKDRIMANSPKSYQFTGIRQDGSEFPVEVQGKIIQWRGKP
jgi:PAS domain S-box-containing protein